MKVKNVKCMSEMGTAYNSIHDRININVKYKRDVMHLI